MKRHPVWAGLVILVLLLLTACGRGAPAPDQILTRSAEAMRRVDSVQWTLTRNGPPIQLGDTQWAILEGGVVAMDVTPFTQGGTQVQPEPGEGLSMLVAKGAYQAPDCMYVVAKAQGEDIITPMVLAWVAGDMLFELSTLKYGSIVSPLPAAFDPTDVFNAETGIPYMLTNVLTNPSLAGEESLNGVETYHITAQAEGQDLSRPVGGAVVQGTATVDLWINKRTSQLVRVIVTEADGNSWRLDLCCYGEIVQPLTS